MVENALEIICGSCGNQIWYSEDNSYPNSIQCSECGNSVQIPEEG